MNSVRPQHRIVITGIGLVTPLGADRETSWQRLQAGHSGTRWLNGERFLHDPASQTPITSTGMLAGAPGPVLPVPQQRAPYEPVVEYAMTAAREALTHAGLSITPENRDQVGVVIGTSKGGLRSFSAALTQLRQTGANSVDADLWLQFQPNAAAATVSATFDCRGPSLCPVAACATGLASMVRAADLIRDGFCDVVLAGSTDASLQPALLSSFHRMGVLARGFEDPASACRPFDRRRNGFLVGEGAAVFVLERYDHALARGVQPLAEWVVGRQAADPAGLTSLDTEAVGLTRLIQHVLEQAGLTSCEVDYANLHGTATIANDICETRAIKVALGPAARELRCSSIKGAVGHMLGAAGSVEMAATLLAMRDGVVPPTINLQEFDDECDLDYTPQTACRRRVENALKLSLGFGGHLVAAVVRECTA